MGVSLKKSLSLILILFLGISCAPVQSETKPLQANRSKAEIKKVALTSVEGNTRQASVKVYTDIGGHGSGTYFLYKGYHVVFTAAHVVANSNLFTIVDMYGNVRVGTAAYISKNVDFAIILIPAFKKIKPIKYKVPKYKPTDEIGRSLIFSGFPGRQSLRTVRALISGVEGRHFVMQSTAWKGSSGSCVFDSDGNFVGILFAVSMSQFSGRPVLLESMVWVEPYNAINWKMVDKYIYALN